MKQKTILPDTSLCAIVRDEMINPAQLPGKSGIRSFVESHVPYVERAVIVDTGSIDGTRQELEQLASEFPNLKVYDRSFDDYASARNDSLKRVKTKRALVLDVDEVITQESFGKLFQILIVPESEYLFTSQVPYFFHFYFKTINSDGSVTEGGGNKIRLFDTKNVLFLNAEDKKGEYLHKTESTQSPSLLGAYSLNVLKTNLPILHFMPDRILSFRDISLKYGACNPEALKMVKWYSYPEKFAESPSLVEGFELWKKPNSHRTNFF